MRHVTDSISWCLAAVILLAVLLAPQPGAAATADVKLAKKQSVYVPVYANIFSGPRKRPIHLEATLSIRGTDPSASLRITAIDYYDTDGRLVRRYLNSPKLLPPLASTHVVIGEKDSSGGIGANFIVRWEADRPINVPVIECLMIGVAGGQGLSFVSTGQEIREDVP